MRPGIEAHVQAAQLATDHRDWAEAVRLWDGLVRRYAMVAPPKAWARLAIAHRELGDHTRAESVLLEAQERFPEDLGLAMEAAQLAMVREDWEQAVVRWTEVLERFPTQAPAKAHARLAISHRECGRLEVAAALLDRANVQFPDDVDLALEWAQFAMVTEDWDEAIRRWEDVLDRFPEQGRARALARLSQCHRELGDFETAERLLADARQRFPDDLLVQGEWAQIPLAREDWSEALARWEALLDRFEAQLPAKAFAQIAVVHRRLRDHAAAATVVERGLGRHPRDPRLAGEWAQLAMVAQDWPAAVSRWQDVLRLRAAGSDEPLGRTRFPRTGSAVDWYELAWQAIVEQWDDIVPRLPEPPDAQLYRAIGRTLADANLPRDADRILGRGVQAIPDDPGLAYDHVEISLLVSHGPGRAAYPATLRDIATRVAGVPTLAAHLHDLADAREGLRTTRHAAVDATLATHAPKASTKGLDRIHVLRVPRESSLDLHVRAGRFLSASILRERVREVSERDRWPEMHAEENLVMARTRRLADSFGERYEDLPFLSADALADALLFPLYHELVLHDPMVRVAADVAAEKDASPVYLEVPSLTFRYLDGYSFSGFDVLYLYFELRRLGVNAVLCRFDMSVRPFQDGADEDPIVPEELRRVRFVPSARAMVPRGEVRRPDHHAHDAAIIPAGLRSVPRVAAAVAPALMYTSGSVVKEFAYDRSIRQTFPVEPHASVHPPHSLMPRFTFELWPAEEIDVEPLTPSTTAAQGVLEATAPIGGDWTTWLDAAMHEWLRELSLRSYADVAARGIRTAHVCDHLFTESVIFANAVKSQGGRVVLWPHSANPVHIDQRRGDAFDEVHAVTRTGADRWRTHFPEHTVHHSPRLMLDPPQPDVHHEADQPLSVVVLGGRSVLRHMPTMDQAAHEASYRAFFTGLEKLQVDHDIDVWFKPRGLTGEHEMWLHQTVGAAAGWRRVLEHPLRLRVANPLFVSISMGTSALLEGLGRGIPGIVVRDFPVRDYTTLDPDAFPTITTEEALELVVSCASGDGWNSLLAHETAYYTAELVDGPGVDQEYPAPVVSRRT